MQGNNNNNNTNINNKNNDNGNLAVDFHKVALLVGCFQVELELKIIFLWSEDNWRTRRKTLGLRIKTKNKFNPPMMPGPPIEPRSPRREANDETKPI